MKEILKKDWPYIGLLFVLLGLTYEYFALLTDGFCTAWDESYFLLKLKEAYEQTYITGKSQWNLIAIHWFPFLDLVNPVHSRIAIWLCEFVGAIISTVTCCVLYDKRRIVRYFSISYLIFFMIPTTYAGESLNYVPMQALLLNSSLCYYLLFQHTNNRWKKFIFSGLVGISLGFALFVIMPSAILILCSIIILMLCHREWQYLVSIIIGIFITCFYIHFVVCPISDIIRAMAFTATYISKSGYGYTPVKFIVSILIFMKDWGLTILFLLGVYWSLSILSIKQWFVGLLFWAVTFVYITYQRNPELTPIPLLSCLLIFPLMTTCKQSGVDGLMRILHSYNGGGHSRLLDLIRLIFVFLFPLLATIGTNTNLGTRMLCFSIAWFFFYMEYINKNALQYEIPKWTIIVFCISLLLLRVTPSMTRRYIHRNETYHFERGNKYFAQMGITHDQKDYLDRVSNILEDYHFVTNKSVVFTSEYDYATVYAIDACLSSNFYQKNNFLYAPVSQMKEPDFIFLCQWDIDVIGEHLKSMPWGWPDDYDKFYVGSPEGINFPWDANRWLYCKKNLK